MYNEDLIKKNGGLFHQNRLSGYSVPPANYYYRFVSNAWSLKHQILDRSINIYTPILQIIHLKYALTAK